MKDKESGIKVVQGTKREHFKCIPLGGSTEWWLKMQQRRWAAAAAEEHVTTALASASSKPRAYYCSVSVSIGKDGKRGCVQCKGRTSEAMAMR